MSCVCKQVIQDLIDDFEESAVRSEKAHETLRVMAEERGAPFDEKNETPERTRLLAGMFVGLLKNIEEAENDD